MCHQIQTYYYVGLGYKVVQHVNLTLIVLRTRPSPRQRGNLQRNRRRRKTNVLLPAGKGPDKKEEKPEGKVKAKPKAPKAKAKSKPKAKVKAASSAKKAPTPKKSPKKPASKEDLKEEQVAQKGDDGNGKASPTIKRPAAKTLPEGEGKCRKAGKSPGGSLSCVSKLFSCCRPSGILAVFFRMRSKGQRGATVCNSPLPSATVCNRSREGCMAVPMVSSAKGVTFGGSKRRIASFRVAGPHLIFHTLHSTLYTLTLRSTFYTPHFTLHTPHPTFYNLHYTLHTLHLTFHTSHSTRYTLHFTLHTLHPTTLYTPHATLHTLHSTHYTPHFTLFFTLHTPHSALFTPHSTLHIYPHSTLYILHSTLHTLYSTRHTLHFTLYTPHFTLYTPHFTLHALHFTLC